MARAETPTRLPRAEHEVLLTLTDRQYEEMGARIAKIREELGLDSTTQVMVEAIRRLADTAAE